MKKKRTGVRPARKAPRAPTRVKKPSKPKASEGARQSPFSSGWKYLDLSPVAASPESGGGGSSRSTAKGVDRAERSQRSLPSRSSHTYFEPPKIQKPFLLLTDKQVLEWFDAQDAKYQSMIVAGVIEWDRYLMEKGKPLGLTLRPGIVKYLRTMARPHCSCGDAGYPNTFHSLDARKCFKRPPAELLIDDEEDDDLPF